MNTYPFFAVIHELVAREPKSFLDSGEGGGFKSELDKEGAEPVSVSTVFPGVLDPPGWTAGGSSGDRGSFGIMGKC